MKQSLFCLFVSICFIIGSFAEHYGRATYDTQASRLAHVRGATAPYCDNYLHTMACDTWMNLNDDCFVAGQPGQEFCSSSECTNYTCTGAQIAGLWQTCQPGNPLSSDPYDHYPVLDLMNCTYENQNCGNKTMASGACQLQIFPNGPRCLCEDVMPTLVPCNDGGRTLKEWEECIANGVG